MHVYKLLPAGFLALALAGTGALVATAQTAPVEPEGSAPQAQAERTDVRFHPDGHRGGHRGDRSRGQRGGSEMIRTLFAQVDADDDGSVTQAEIDSFRATTVGGADTSGDGALSLEEFDTIYRAFTRSRMVDAFQRLDADGSGAVEADELEDRFGDIVDRMDRDGDGALTVQDRGRG